MISNSRKWCTALAGVATLATACAESTTGSDASADVAALSASLASVPVGYGDLSTSYVGTPSASVATAGALWLLGGREARMDRGDFMGGGLDVAFVGGDAGDRGFGGHHGPFGGVFGGGADRGFALGCTGSTFAASTGRVSCPTETRNGLTIVRSAAYTNTAGQVQQAFDTLTTNTVNSQVAVTGTVTFDRSAQADGGPDGRGHGPRLGGGPGGRLLGDTATVLTASTTVQSSSNRTVSGLAQGSATRTVNGTSNGREATTGTSSRGAFTASRTVADTTRGVTVPNRTAATATAPTYPTAGTVIRTMQATLTFSGQAATTVTRREVVTYDGSATAKVSITENGTTRSCTQPLPRGRLVCS